MTTASHVLLKHVIHPLFILFCLDRLLVFFDDEGKLFCLLPFFFIFYFIFMFMFMFTKVIPRDGFQNIVNISTCCGSGIR